MLLFSQWLKVHDEAALHGSKSSSDRSKWKFILFSQSLLLWFIMSIVIIIFYERATSYTLIESEISVERSSLRNSLKN